MTLKDFIILHKDECEITVFDAVYDIETYFNEKGYTLVQIEKDLEV